MTLEDIIIKCDYCKRKFESIKAVRIHSKLSHGNMYKVNVTIKEKNWTISDCIAMQEINDKENLDYSMIYEKEEM